MPDESRTEFEADRNLIKPANKIQKKTNSKMEFFLEKGNLDREFQQGAAASPGRTTLSEKKINALFHADPQPAVKGNFTGCPKILKSTPDLNNSRLRAGREYRVRTSTNETECGSKAVDALPGRRAETRNKHICSRSRKKTGSEAKR
jgi:hypothetical protein